MELFNRLVIGMMPVVPKSFVGRVASRYIAGETLQDAVQTIRKLNQSGAMATLDVLGEHSTDRAHVVQATETYLKVLDTIKSENIDANVSLKPTHLGLAVGYDFSFEQIERVVSKAAEYGNFVRIDMENTPYTDDTFKMHRILKDKYNNVGVVIQAYLRRTLADTEELIKLNANLRLCKGIYREHRTVAYKNRSIIINNYALVLEKLLSHGCYVGIATHCEETVWHALRVIDKLKLNRDQYEFQMLLGVDEELRKILIDAGHRLRVYVPFGKEWYAYSTRRLKENPQIAGYVVRDFLGLSKHDGNP